MKKIIITLLVSQFMCLSAEKLEWNHNVPLQLIRGHLPENPIILEAGAHYAQDTRCMADVWPKGTIHAFEPTPVNLKKVREAAEEYANVIAYSYALDIECGVKLFYQDSDEDRGNQGANSLLLHNLLAKSSNPPIQVECITIDKWAHQEGVDRIDFMWLDMEGNELNALKGAGDILSRVKVIFTEVNFREFWHGCAQYEPLKKYLEELGFKEVWKDIQPCWNGNVLFVRNDYAQQ